MKFGIFETDDELLKSINISKAAAAKIVTEVFLSKTKEELEAKIQKFMDRYLVSQVYTAADTAVLFSLILRSAVDIGNRIQRNISFSNRVACSIYKHPSYKEWRCKYMRDMLGDKRMEVFRQRLLSFPSLLDKGYTEYVVKKLIPFIPQISNSIFTTDEWKRYY